MTFSYIPYEIPPRAYWPSVQKLQRLAPWGAVIVGVGFFAVQPWDWMAKMMKPEEPKK